MQDESLDGQRPPQRSRGGARFLAAALVVALVLGGALTLWAGREAGWIAFPTTSETAAPDRQALADSDPGFDDVLVQPVPNEQVQAALGVRMAELEQRMTRLNLQADAASGNAARAEGLLVAFAARRAVERGSALGYLENQLKLRFGNAQPNAVDTVVEAGKRPVTLDMLDEGLTSLAPTLTQRPDNSDMLERLGHELSSLFVIRKVGTPSAAPEQRLQRAAKFIDAGRVDAAITEVEGMPGREAATRWLALARRFVATQRALDLIETAAVLEPRQLQDSTGNVVLEPNPEVTPGPPAPLPEAKLLPPPKA